MSCSARPDQLGSFPFPGNYDKPREIGAEAVEKLARKIALGQRGVPENPRTTLVRGAWVGSLPAPRRTVTGEEGKGPRTGRATGE